MLHRFFYVTMILMLNEVAKFIEEATGYASVQADKEMRFQLPQYLHALYELVPVKIHSIPAVIAILKGEDIPKTNELKAHEKAISKKTEREVVFVFRRIPPQKRATYAKNHLAHIVLGSEIYLPFILLKIHALQSKQRQQPDKPQLTTWPQIIVTRQLVHQDMTGCTGTELAARFKVTKMTISRAIQELEATSICRIVYEARRKIIQFGSKVEIWRGVYPLLRNPIHTIEQCGQLPQKIAPVLTGISALAEKTTLAPPKIREYAIDKRERKYFTSNSWLAEDNQPNCQIQFWNWNPKLTAIDDIVDPVSLYLSMKNIFDERVGLARDEYLDTIGLSPIASEEAL